MNTKYLLGFTALLVLIGSASSAFAGWTVTNLHPAGATSSEVREVSGNQAFGSAQFPGYVWHAGLWSGTADTWMDLNPAGAGGSHIYGASAGQQVGYASIDSTHAGLWSGTAGSWIDLHPVGATDSSASGTSGTQQVGSAYFGTVHHAGLWSGTAESWADLNPSESWESAALDTSGTQQVGYAAIGGYYHAGLWSGTAASWDDLNPAGSPLSYAYGMSANQQVGVAQVGGSWHASLWNGTAASWVDLNPAGSLTSQANDALEGWQVGQAFGHAGLWRGTVESWVDLNSYLPSAYTSSYASSIAILGEDILVGGYAYNSGLARNEAVLWRYTDVVPEPSSFMALLGGMGMLGFLHRRRKRRILLIVACVAVCCLAVAAQADVFNMGEGLTNLDTVVVGDPGNAPITYFNQERGAIDHSYLIGKYEVTAGQYADFLNQKAQSDPHALYSTYMDAQVSPYRGCNIQRTGSPGSYTYSVAADWANRPVNYVSFWDACRFANWMHNGRGNGDTEAGAYALNGNEGQNGAVQRSAAARWFVPNENEWFKAAYYKGGGPNAGYWMYPTQSNSLPSNQLLSPDPGNNADFAAYYGQDGSIGDPYYRTRVGEFANSESAYGTFDQGGNVFEWNEDQLNEFSHAVRGGSYYDDYYPMRAEASWGISSAAAESENIGFRIGGVVPEPSSLLALGSGLLALSGLIRRRR